MAIVTLGDVMDRGRAYEERLAECYADIRDRSADNGVRLLTYYLARHRRHQRMALDGLEPEILRRVRKIELKFDVPFLAMETPRPQFPAVETLKGDALIEIAIRQDEALVDMYRRILEQPLSDDARAVVEALIRVEERDLVMLKKMLAMHYF